MSNKIAYFLALTFSVSSLAASHMLVIGGGGEPQRDHTIFDQELNNVTNYVQNSMWNTRISFNGGHAKTEQIAQRFAGKSNGRNSHFTAEAYEALITEYERKINQGQIKRGDQLLLMISSHGSQKIGNQKTHQISTSSQIKSDNINYNTLKGSPTVSLDRLEKLTKLAESKGIRLGILDFSCHSGLTQKLANKNTCVISSTGPEHFSWAGAPSTFSSQFTSKMRQGRTLEDVFLDAMKNKRDTSFPMISSGIGKELQDTMYPLISPYLHDTRNQVTTNKLKQFYIQRYAKDRCENLNEDYKELVDFTYDIENIVSQANYTKLRSLLSQYHTLQQGMIQNTKLMNKQNDYVTKKKYCEQAGSLKYCLTYSQLEILNLDINQMISLLTRQMATASPTRKENLTYTIKIYRNLQNVKDKLLADETIKAANNFWEKSAQLKTTEKLASEIATEAQNAYYNTYKAIQREEGSPGPCSQIKL